MVLRIGVIFLYYKVMQLLEKRIFALFLSDKTAVKGKKGYTVVFFQHRRRWKKFEPLSTRYFDSFSAQIEGVRIARFWPEGGRISRSLTEKSLETPCL